MRQIFTATIFILAAVTLLFSQDNPKFKEDTTKSVIAVLQLDNNGVSESETRALTDRLRLELFRNEKYEVMERQKVNSILEEMQFQLSGCTSDECAIEVGRMIGVKKMVAGAVSKVGEYYTVSARIIDIETGKIELTAVVDMEGTLGEVLTQAIPSIARQLSEIPDVAQTIQNKVGALHINSTPEGANIFINNEYKGITPLKLKVKAGATQTVKISKNGYATWEKDYVLDPGQVVDFSIRMDRKVIPQEPEKEKVVKEDKEKNGRKRVFRLAYYAAGNVDKLNENTLAINQILMHNIPLFNDLNSPAFSYDISAFQGLAITSGQQVADQFFLDFTIGLMGSTIDEKSESLRENNFKLIYGLVNAGLNLRWQVIDVLFIKPYLLGGVNYNFLAVHGQYNDDAVGDAFYSSWGLVLGTGFEFRISDGFGIDVEWNRMGTTMALADVGDNVQNFENAGFDEMEMGNNFFKVQLNFYSNR